MNIAVLTLTRDRLAYTQHCFGTLRENAGCEYDHFVLDQASEDGTVEWLAVQDDLNVVFASENIGINQGLNELLDNIILDHYDVVVKFDNDCELLTPDTLRDIAEVVQEHDVILSPHICGLRNPPERVATYYLGEHTVSCTHVVGGIFMAVPAHVYRNGYRHDDRAPLWGDDDHKLSFAWRFKGRILGYLDGYDANHYLTTDGQHADIPDYFARTLAEGKPSIL